MSTKAQRQAKLTVVRDDEQPTEQPTTETPATQTPADTSTASTSVAELQATRRALDEQIKAAKATQPKPEKPAKQAKTLTDVIAQQTARPRTDLPRILTTYVLQRQAAGQDRYEALEQVLGQMRSIVLGSLDSRQPGETYHAAIFRYLGRTDLLDTPAADEPDADR